MNFPEVERGCAQIDAYVRRRVSWQLAHLREDVVRRLFEPGDAKRALGKLGDSGRFISSALGCDLTSLTGAQGRQRNENSG